MGGSRGVSPRGLSFLKTLAMAAVYATHLHYVPFGWHHQAKSAVSHFFIHSGLLAYLSLLSPLSKTSLGRDRAWLSNVFKFCVKDLWITWVVFILKRLLVLGLYCHLYRILIIKNSPEYKSENAEWRVLTHLWNHFWYHPHGKLLTGDAHLWFLSALALYWVVTPPVAAFLFALPDPIALLVCLGYVIFSVFAIGIVPHTNNASIFYFSPQTHWPAYALGIFVWRARDCQLTRRFFQNEWFTRRSLWTWFLFPLVTEVFSYTFIWWQKHVILHPIRTENDFIDLFYRTNTYMALLIFLWSTPLADHSLLVKFASARYWDRVAPGGINLGMFVIQWNLSLIINGSLRGLSGRSLTMVLTFLGSVWSEVFFLRPLRDFFTPYFNQLQKVATAPQPIIAKDSTLPMFNFKAVDNT